MHGRNVPKDGKKREKEGKCIKRCTKRWDSSSFFPFSNFSFFLSLSLIQFFSYTKRRKKEIRAKEERMKEKTSASTCFHSREERKKRKEKIGKKRKEKIRKKWERRENLDTFTFPLDTFHRVIFCHLRFYFFHSLNFFSFFLLNFSLFLFLSKLFCP